MNIRGLSIALLVLVVLQAEVSAAESKEVPAERVLLLLRKRPLLVEFRLTIDEQPFAASQSDGTFAVQGQAFLASRTDGSQLMELLDRNSDGGLSDEEVNQAPARLRLCDADDNELVSLVEIAGFRANAFAGNERVMAAQETILGIRESTDWKQLHALLVDRYGAQGALPWAVPLDTDGDGTLSADEVQQLATAPAPLVLDVGLGTRTRLRDTVVVTHIADELKRIARIDRGADGKLLLDLITLRMEVLAPNPKPSPQTFAGQATAYLSNFDKDKNGYLERKEVTDPALAAQFPTWDTDGNGMVFVDELRAALEQADRPNWQRVSVAALVEGTDLFAQLDTDGDQQLGHREVADAADRLRDVVLADEETIRLAIARGNETYRYLSKGKRPLNLRTRNAEPAAAENADWFFHMDTNGDGDISRREFLGNDEQFEKLDANADGFLERSETR